jgi:hypothetical protein
MVGERAYLGLIRIRGCGTQEWTLSILNRKVRITSKANSISLKEVSRDREPMC